MRAGKRGRLLETFFITNDLYVCRESFDMIHNDYPISDGLTTFQFNLVFPRVQFSLAYYDIIGPNFLLSFFKDPSVISR